MGLRIARRGGNVLELRPISDETLGSSPKADHSPADRLTIADSFGARLRRERERRKISLDSIAANTKISISLLTALERDDTSRWPSGVFRRAFIRGYAQAIGLDADQVAREFLERFPDPQVESPIAPLAEARETARPAAAHMLRLTFADTRVWFVADRFLSGPHSRWAAVGCDVGTVASIALLMFLVLGVFWMPLAVSTLSYYAIGILVLGNTPGVCLFAPASRRKLGPPSTPLS
jgi:transcriptional regulator with XRE-family HTH domain